jgi:predicted RNA-binding protein with PUA-like domain
MPVEQAKNFWLMKSEPNVFSIDDLANCNKKTEPWSGVRNYQARNFMRDDMAVGDMILFYHSSCAEPGIVGLAKVAKKAYPDATQFDVKSEYYDPKATLEKPRWFNVDVKYVKKTKTLPILELRKHRQLEKMALLRKGCRLSITPVSTKEWEFIQKLL